MTITPRRRPWSAVLAPVGVPNDDGETILGGCQVDVSPGAKLVDSQPRIWAEVGTVDTAGIRDGYLVAAGMIDRNIDTRWIIPTFAATRESHVASTSGDRRPWTTQYQRLTIAGVDIGERSRWGDHRIGFGEPFPDWYADLAPVGVRGQTGQVLSPDCVVSVRDGCALVGPESIIGWVIEVSVVDGRLVAAGVLYGDQEPAARPTFGSGSPPLVEHEDGHGPTFTFTELRVDYVTAYELGPAWPDDQLIGFFPGWCVYLPSTDEVIPMPDRATADRAATRFNAGWEEYTRRRAADDGARLPGCRASVIRWPHETGHAEGLASLRDGHDPDGWLTVDDLYPTPPTGRPAADST